MGGAVSAITKPFTGIMGGLSGKSGDTSSSSSVTNPSSVWGAQAPYLQDLYKQASELSKGSNQQYTDFFNQGMRQGVDPGVTSWLQGFQTPGVNPMFNAYSQQLGQQFREQILPSMRGEAALAGGLGNSRAQIGQALAGQRAMEQLGNFGAQTYGQDRAASLSAAQTLGDLSGQNRALQGQMATQAMASPWYNLRQFAGILGNPTVLSGGGSSSAQSSQGWTGQISNMLQGFGSLIG